MKLTEIAIEGNTPTVQNRFHLSPLEPGLNFVYGENGAGKSTLARFLRKLHLDGQIDLDPRAYDRPHDRAGTLSSITPTGQVSVTSQHGAYRIARTGSGGSAGNVTFHPLVGDTNGRVRSIEQLTGSLSALPYDTAYNFSLRNALTSRKRLASWLHDQRQVPLGPEALNDDQDWPARQQRIASLQTELQLISQAIDDARARRQTLAREIEGADQNAKTRLHELNRQIEQVEIQLGHLNPSLLRSQLAMLDQEINSLQASIDAADAHAVQQPVATPAIDSFAQLYHRLDELDQQLHRWRDVQSDVQQQRVRLKDEMLVWNDMTLESDEHPYHNAREILVGLEARVDQAEQTARRWAGTTASQIDVTQMAAAVDELCGQMRQDLYGLCQELSTQYKTIRQRAAALELKQLRRCYHEMGENTQRLVQRRARVLSEIRSVDPAGADAIERSEHAFCECAKHEGYLNARRRYLGELTSTAPKVTVVRPDTTRQRQQLSTLQQRRSELLSSLAASEAGHADLERQRIELTRQRDGVHIIDVSPLREQVAQIDADLASKHTRQRSLSSELDAELAVKHVPANPTLVHASQLLNQMTRGELTGLFLQPATGSNGNLGERFDMLVLDSRGTTHEFTSLSNARQHQAYLSLALATVATIGRPHQVEVPVVIDDAFVQIGPQDVDATLATLHDFSVQNDQQILLLSQHRYLADRLPGMPVFELASPDVRTQTIPAARPETVTRHEVTAPKRYDSRLVSSGVVANVLPAVSADRFKLPPEQAQPPQPISNRPYPLSKYSTNPAAAENHLWPALADETHQQDDYRLPWSPLNQSIQQRTGHTSQQKVKPMSARAFVAGQPATPVVAAIALDTLGLMDAQRLVMLADCGVTTAEQLLNIDIDRLSPSFDGHGITGRQVESWQDQAWLLQAIPQLQADEARLLVACGITDPQHLATSHADQLFERIQRYIGSAEGQRFLRSSGNGRDSYSLNMSNVQRWYQSLNDNRSAWENRSSRRSSRRRSRRASDRNWNRSTSSRSNEHESRARTFNVGNYPQRSRTSQATEYSRSDRDSQSRRSNSSRSGFTSDSNSESSRRSSRSESRTRSERSTTKRSKRSSRSSSSEGRLKFYLDLADHIEAAPSIGPKTAERFEAIGVSTVADFLRQTAESMATRLDYKRLSADTLRTWQHQTRLVCRVPNLRGHDAQLLVACGVTEPEELATLQPQSLFGIVGPFSETKEGLKIIRSGKKPDLAEITDWIQWAEHTRSLQAA